MSNSAFIDQCIGAINNYRHVHQVAPLVHNPQLSGIAQQWVDHLAETDSFGHNPDASYKGERLGENCAMSWSQDGKEVTGAQIADQWYSEVERYDFAKNSGPSTGHFTQTVWKSSREIGIGRSRTSGGKWLVVANFLPAGNYLGHNAENVFPPRDGQKPTIKKDSNKDDLPAHRGETVSRKIRTETTGSGPDAVTKTIITETRTAPDGTTKTTITEKVTKGQGGSHHSDEGQIESKMRNVQLGTNNSCADSCGSKEPSQICPATFIDDVIQCHNVYRAKHGQVEPLVHNPELTGLAQTWAEHLAAIGSLQHNSDRYQGQPIGQNVAAKSGSGRVDYTAQQAVDQWYKEAANFDYAVPEGRPGVSTGHFSQVVWKSSREIGVGKATSADGRQAYVVCNYFPAGNYKGRYHENVLPPK